MFGKKKNKKQEAVKEMEAKASTSTETPTGATEKAPEQPQAVNSVPQAPQPKPQAPQGMPQQATLQGMPQQMYQQPMPQGYPQGYGYGPAQGYPQGQPMQGWAQMPQGQRPMSQPMQAPQGWMQMPQGQPMPQQARPVQQTVPQGQPFVQPPHPTQSVSDPQGNTSDFSFDNFHHKDDQSKKSDFSYNMDPSMQKPREFTFGGQPIPQQMIPNASEVTKPVEEKTVKKVEEKVEGSPVTPAAPATPVTPPTPNPVPQPQAPYTQPMQGWDVSVMPAEAPKQEAPKPQSQAPTGMFVPGFVPMEEKVDEKVDEKVEETAVTPNEFYIKPAGPVTPEVEYEDMLTPKSESVSTPAPDAYMDVMRNTGGQKVDYRATPEPTPGEDVYQPEYVTPTPQTEFTPVQPMVGEIVGEKKEILVNPTVEEVPVMEATPKVEETAPIEAPTTEWPTKAPVYEDVLKDREFEKLDMEAFKDVFENSEKPKEEPKPVVKLERMPDEKGHVFKSKKERERERQAEEEKAARERMRKAKEAEEKAKHPELKCTKEAEHFLMYDLMKSLNTGNCGMYKTRADMAKAQLEELVKMGYDLDTIYIEAHDTL